MKELIESIKIKKEDIIKRIDQTRKHHGQCFFKILDSNMSEKIIEDSLMQAFKLYGPGVVLIVDDKQIDDCVEIFRHYSQRIPHYNFSNDRETIIKIIKDGVVLSNKSLANYTNVVKNTETLH